MNTRVVRLPNGRRVSLGVYCAAWRSLKTYDADRPITGWDGFPVPAERVLREMRAGVHERINRHIPGFNKGRNWQPSIFYANMRFAGLVNARCVVRERDVPQPYRRRLAHRIDETA